MKVKIAKTFDINPGGIKAFEHNGAPVAICRIDGNFYAFEDICTHMEYPLSIGILNGEELTCLAHGARFNVRTGSVISMPAAAPLKKFNTIVEGDDIFVDLD